MITGFPIGKQKEEVITAPSLTGGGTLQPGWMGIIYVGGSVSNVGSALEYFVDSYSGLSSISPTENIPENGGIQIVAGSSQSTYSVSVYAKSSRGTVSQKTTISGEIQGIDPITAEINSIPFMYTWRHPLTLPLVFKSNVSGTVLLSSFYLNMGPYTVNLQPGTVIKMSGIVSDRIYLDIYVDGVIIDAFNISDDWDAYDIRIRY